MSIEGQTAPRVTQADVDNAIAAQHTFNAWDAIGNVPIVSPTVVGELKRMTIAVLVLQTGFIVTGESACADIANFDAALGSRLAIEDAKRKIWPLLGYSLKSALAGRS